MKKLVQNLSLLFASILVSIVIAELVTRLIYPVPVGLKMLTIDGQHIINNKIETPGLKYRLVSSEFDAVVNITDDGYRVPLVKDNPDIIFVGDSFTFGYGLHDEETFVYQYCSTLNISCANLGKIGTGTILQMKRLEKYLTTQKWRPKKVYLFMLAMTSFLSHGNDLTDNLKDYNKGEKKITSSSSAKEKVITSNVKEDISHSTNGKTNLLNNLFEKILASRNKLWQHSNLVRILYKYFGVELRSIFFPKSRTTRINEALEITKEQLLKLDRLSNHFGFEYDIFLLHPLQDITNNTYRNTLKELQNISPVIIHGTGHLFENNTRNFYYFTDGHFNVNGSNKIAEFLLSRDSSKIINTSGEPSHPSLSICCGVRIVNLEELLQYAAVARICRQPSLRF